ncbi:glycosyl hydrolase 2 galactose-binding domain-containing protein [Granulicella aggregans]|uniref:glycosyl hydrolase 2 galactose-binding domain-containing protein n=1 Tax=Granulicella aggregans TaxID=474949 RepID=UPI001621E240|nr:glycoside hydrolase family 2 TIM barrel-domain containing protein [Granulicella aggregans]
MNRAGRSHLVAVALGFIVASPFLQHRLHAQAHVLTVKPETTERIVGPYDVNVLRGGPGLTKAMPPASEVLSANSVSTLSAWVLLDQKVPETTLIAGLGDPSHEDSRFIGLRDLKLVLRLGKGRELTASRPLNRNGWHLLTATFAPQGTHLYADSVEVASGSEVVGRVDPQLMIAPAEVLPGEPFIHFGGLVAQVTVDATELSREEVRARAVLPPNPALLRPEEASQPWPVQTREQAGYLAPQDPALMPHSREPFSKPIALPLPPLSATALTPREGSAWTVSDNWMLTTAPNEPMDGAALSESGYDSRKWMRATVPGTVLTTMVDRGVYPDPDFGLNNLAIPESLNKQSYWYRVEFETPRQSAGHHLSLTFNGINYAAEVWLNGHELGSIKGAFIRGSFDVSSLLRKDGRNALAVLILPPPHPGIPQEQSMLGGPGENGGAMCLDGPTFVATEGWDWIPAIRDRNMGIWQDVVLSVTDQLQIGDPQVITRLPLPETSSADVEITVPVQNHSAQSVTAEVHAEFEGVQLSKAVTLASGETKVKLTRAEFPQLHVDHPRLWWPNGYGRPDLYHLKLTVGEGSQQSDLKTLTFGIREITYELSLFDTSGAIRRVEVSPAEAKARNEQVVDVRHEGMRNREADFYSASLTAAGEHSTAVKSVTDEPGLTDLVLKVNGVRIAARGGNWGMDDSRKRVSREHLEPYFRLHREANMNIIRNWVGQNTEETFYQLADEYGMMVWNDFWASTQNYNVEPEDVPLFLKNARDVVARFRNHPSIVMWCGRNEGVPQPTLNEGLIDVFREEDGTRYYTPGSNRINLRNSGPYFYQQPDLYYTKWDRGFSVELGIPSPSTLEALKSSMAPADQWPIGDAWAYHDWHQEGNGLVEPFMHKLEQEFGAATSLEDFERKAQMLSYVEHRAIFEGFNQHLWTPNSGRMLWMTQPAWPSNMWQIFNSDYDTPGSFYGVKKACESLHVQLDLSDFTVAAVNTSNTDSGSVSVKATVYSLANQVLLTQEKLVPLGADRTAVAFPLDLAPLFAAQGVVLVKLEMKDGSGTVVSDNTYWLAGDDDEYRKLNDLARVKLSANATSHTDGEETVVELKLTNPSTTAALATKAVLLNAKSGSQILPAYFSDNYVSLLPNETKSITVHYPSKLAVGKAKIDLRGWNVEQVSVDVTK